MSIPSDKKKVLMQCDENEVLSAYTAYFRRYYPSLLAYVSRFLDAEQAEDVVQDAFMDLWLRREKIDMSEHLGAFLYRSVYTKALNNIKHSTVVKNHGQAVIEIYNKKLAYFSPDNDGIIEQLENKELRKEVYDVIESLPDKCKEVFKLSYLHDLKNKQIADVMGISVKTVEAHMYKALKVLRVRLGHLVTFLLAILSLNS